VNRGLTLLILGGIFEKRGKVTLRLIARLRTFDPERGFPLLLPMPLVDSPNHERGIMDRTRTIRLRHSRGEKNYNFYLRAAAS